MDILWLVLTLLAIGAWLTWLWRLVARDGLGDRRPPASHEAWQDRDGRPSVPVGSRS